MKSINTNTHGFDSLGKYQSKGSAFHGQMKTVFKSFEKQSKTMLMVSFETGILRANICRYIAKWYKENKIMVVKTGICQISKRRANYYTTNPNYFTQPQNKFNHGK